MFSEGVSAGRISLNRFVELTSTNHAKIYGLYPRKGSIGIGFDADITLWDAHRRETIRQENLHHGSDYTPWEGFEVTGWPVMTIARILGFAAMVRNNRCSRSSTSGTPACVPRTP